MEKSSKSISLGIVSSGWLLLTFLLITNIQSGNCTVSTGSSSSWEYYRRNSSTTATTTSTTSSIADDQEFLMQTQFGNLLAPPNRNRHLAYRTEQSNPSCPLPRYANCLVTLDGNHRPCGFKERCVRHIS